MHYSSIVQHTGRRITIEMIDSAKSVSFMFTSAQSRFGLAGYRLPRDLRLASIACALAIAACIAGGFCFNTIFIPSAGRPSFVWLTDFFFRVQDAPWLLWIALMLLGFGILRLPTTTRYAAPAMLRNPRVAIAILTALVFVCGIIGTHVIFHGFPLARDEILGGVPNTTAERMNRFEFARAHYSWASSVEQYANILRELIANKPRKQRSLPPNSHLIGCLHGRLIATNCSRRSQKCVSSAA
jgi:hypothetical protein